MKDRASVVIVGGGVVGCAVAYCLSKEGMDVALFERSYLGSGATGKSSGGIRKQFADEISIRLAVESFKMWEELEEELEYKLDFCKNGYLFLASKEKNASQLRHNVELQNKFGVDSRFLETEEEVKQLVPILDTKKLSLRGGSWCPTDGMADPFKVVEGYALAAEKLGANIYKYTAVRDIKLDEHESMTVATDRGNVQTEIVVNAAGVYSGYINQMVGIQLPTWPEMYEMLATDPMMPVNRGSLLPFVVFMDFFPGSVSLHQTTHGELVSASARYYETPTISSRVSFRVIERVAKMVNNFFPSLRPLHIVRTWAGPYEMTPDALPILGSSEDKKGFIQANGFGSHGFMTAPAVANLISELILRGHTSMPSIMQLLSPERFAEGEFLKKRVRFSYW